MPELPVADVSLKRWLVLASHHDDESLFFGGTIDALASARKEAHVVVLTGVEYENPPPVPPSTPEDSRRERTRQITRLHAFANAAVLLGAKSMSGLAIPQVQKLSPCDAYAVEEWAYRELLRFVHGWFPDAILTHGKLGEYTTPQYATGWETARAQHALAYRLAVRLPVPRVFAYDLAGEYKVGFDRSVKEKSLAFYRLGCTQAVEWNPMMSYPEFVETEAFTEVQFP